MTCVSKYTCQGHWRTQSAVAGDASARRLYKRVEKVIPGGRNHLKPELRPPEPEIKKKKKKRAEEQKKRTKVEEN